MTRKIIHTDTSKLGNLRCDNPKCAYVDRRGLPFAEYRIGERCPRCGWNLLTRQDYDRVMKTQRMVDRVNWMFGWLFGSELAAMKKKPHVETTISRKGGTTDVSMKTIKPERKDHD